MIEEMARKILWLGHGSFRIDAEKTIYMDPYQIGSGPKADLILLSHEHFDHCSPEDVARIRKEDTVIVTEGDSAKKLTGDVRVVRPGDTVTVEGIEIRAVPAYNVDKEFHPKKKGWVGFIVKIQGVTIYHAGDTDFIPEMEGLEVDIALLPVSGTYVMTADQAAKAARALRPKLAIPMHYGAIVGDEEDARRFQAALAGEVEVRVPRQG